MKKNNFYLAFICILAIAVIIQGQPTDGNAIFTRAVEKIKTKDYDGAIQDFTEVIRLTPNASGAYLNRGICFYFKKAAEPKKSYQEEADIYANLKPGETPPKSQNSLSAIADLTKAIQLGSKTFAPYYYRGWIYQLEKDLEPAINDLEKAIELKPNYEQDQNLKGLKNTIIKTRNEYADSLTMRANYLGVLDSYARESEARSGTVSSQMSENKKLALELFKKAIQYYSPNDFYTFQSRGNAYRSLENWSAAIADYTKALKFNSNDLYLLNERAELYQKIGQTQKALDEFSRIITMQNLPANGKTYQNIAYLNRGRLYAEQGKTDEAIADFDKLIANDPKYFIAYYERGKLHAKKGNKQLAHSDFVKAGEAANLAAISKKEIDILDGKIKPQSVKPMQTNQTPPTSNSTVGKQKLTFQRPALTEQVSYEGEVVNGKANGKGIGKTNKGDVYEGEWKDNDFHGRGFIRYSFGDTYDGWWQNGKQTGYGTYNWANGNRHVGKMENFVLDGFGILYQKDGTTTEGYWVNGKYVGKNPPTASQNQMQSAKPTNNGLTSNLSNQLVWRKTNSTDVGKYGSLLGLKSPNGINAICRGEYAGGVHPGLVLNSKCNIGYNGKEIALVNYEVFDTTENPNFELLAKEGEKYIIGKESDGTPLYLCYLNYQDWWLPGKVVKGNCNYTWQGVEYYSTNYLFGFISSKNTGETDNSVATNNI